MGKINLKKDDFTKEEFLYYKLMKIKKLLDTFTPTEPYISNTVNRIRGILEEINYLKKDPFDF